MPGLRVAAAPDSIDCMLQPVPLSFSGPMVQDAFPQPVAEQMHCPSFLVIRCGSIYLRCFLEGLSRFRKSLAHPLRQNLAALETNYSI